jgi:thiol peroxidase
MMWRSAARGRKLLRLSLTMADDSIEERPGAFSWDGRPLTLLGRPLSVGDKAPDFRLIGKGFRTVTLQESAGNARLISVVPSLDTYICDKQTRRFNEEAAEFDPDQVTFLTVSGEHPINQGRWCAGAGIKNMEVLSDIMDMNFGNAYGTHIKEMRLDQRAVFVIDADDVIRYIEYAPELGMFPDYEAALAALNEVVGG